MTHLLYISVDRKKDIIHCVCERKNPVKRKKPVKTLSTSEKLGAHMLAKKEHGRGTLFKIKKKKKKKKKKGER